MLSSFALLAECVCVCVCLTVEEESHTRQPLHRSDEQVHKRLSAALRLGLVDLHNPSVTATDTMRRSVFLQDIFSLKLRVAWNSFTNYGLVHRASKGFVLGYYLIMNGAVKLNIFQWRL